jgi:hypothetical protein
MKKHKANELIDIFGPNGPLNAKDIVDFEAKMADLGAPYELQLPSFCLYFRDRLVPLLVLRHYVVAPHLSKNSVPMNWKNNSCEAMNHIMKLNINWRPSKLPDLINHLHDIVT